MYFSLRHAGNLTQTFKFRACRTHLVVSATIVRGPRAGIPLHIPVSHQGSFHSLELDLKKNTNKNMQKLHFRRNFDLKFKEQKTNTSCFG